MALKQFRTQLQGHLQAGIEVKQALGPIPSKFGEGPQNIQKNGPMALKCWLIPDKILEIPNLAPEKNEGPQIFFLISTPVC